jgi:hypothetical protein
MITPEQYDCPNKTWTVERLSVDTVPPMMVFQKLLTPSITVLTTLGGVWAPLQ